MQLQDLRSAVEWRDGCVEVIDQTVLPQRVEVRRLASVEEVVDAIRRLVVRGAPAIGVCAAFGVVVGLDQARPRTTEEANAHLDRLVEEIGGARPTAVNLSWAVKKVATAARRGTSPEEVRRLALEEALRIEQQDQEACRRIAEAGRAELASARRLLTHCNTGRLASAGIGTALGIVYAKAEAGEPVEVLASETRPLLQGARLTAWELSEAGIPVTLLPDTAAGAAIAGGLADCVVVGCDRVAANGDTANKIGTYSLAVLARASGIPFYVAGPMTSFDPGVADGKGIVIEQRSADEVRMVGDKVVNPRVDVFNPAFDVTPAELVTAFITDCGVLRPPFERSIALALEEAETLGRR
ncbi:MAG TPA: S-methyl-5-thioribose-1-phosphate isomerase [Acidimicrobiales bacterium]|nr:S-methyl-5-thioribose-1-phosphate isomerase [Acidimicrobiales bacterium]